MRPYCLLLVLALPAILGQDAEKRVIPIPPQGKIALVIGNGDYVSQSKIPQAVNDAVDMEKTLTGLDFRVILVKNAQIGELDRKLDEFYTAIRPGALAWFFYSGHGGSLGEENYLLPVEFRQQETESGVERNAVAVSKIRNRMEERCAAGGEGYGGRAGGAAGQGGGNADRVRIGARRGAPVQPRRAKQLLHGGTAGAVEIALDRFEHAFE
jgi:hypothetical protein